ncbi:MAG: antitoxin [Thiothrix lacustris]|uniref:Antitoxin n=1 Tax=Thiothrix lacustris TaxID=525917 RepID=A0A1Y1QJY0_9GAMM|nr:MAG: antitoxin [Thiothrix lacustris]
MQAVTYSEARNNLATMLDKAVDDHEHIIIIRKSGKNAVLMSLEDFNAWQETDYLLSSPANAKRLLKSLENVRNGKGLVHKALVGE